MPEKYLEENRYLYIESKLGPNELLLESFEGSEGISQLFSFQLELLSENRQIKFEDILGQDISFGVAGSEKGEQPRYIHGIVTAFAQLPDTARLARYRAIVSPKLWTLTKKANCRIFQNLTVPDILKKILGGMDLAWELQGSYVKHEFCVQYRETDFNFASRLMEEEGIFYSFRHSKTAHKLVIADYKSSHGSLPGGEYLNYDDVPGGPQEEIRVSSWIKTQELGPGKYSLQDYFFETPGINLSASKDILPSAPLGKITHKLKVGGNDQFEIYDYPGGYEKKPQGEEIAKHAMEQLEMEQFVIRGESNAPHLAAGYEIILMNHPHAAGPYFLTSITLSAKEGGFHSAKEIGENQCQNVFYAIPFGLQFRPRPTASKPHVWGCQTAVVVGPPGEEIYTDKYGRVKVQFHWDREGQNNDSSSCWIRFATHWAGKNWGAIHIPRIGHEVIVDFLEGDPDRPIIVGSVYNGSNPPPFTVPERRTESGIQSRSTPGGDPKNFNMIRFEDKKGQETLEIHAERTMVEGVEGSQFITVGGDRHVTTGGVDKNGNLFGDTKEKVFRDRHLHVLQDCYEKIEGKSNNQVVGDADTAYENDRRIWVKGRIIICAMDEIILDASNKVTIQSGPQNYIQIGPTGVTIVGTPKIDLNPMGANTAPCYVLPKPVDPTDP